MLLEVTPTFVQVLLKLPATINVNMMTKQTSKVGATLAPLNVGS